MATRSMIGVMHGDICKAVYCHWDGYLENNGRILFENYDSAKANHLVSLGDISSLRETIGEKHPFSSIGTPNLSYEDYQKLYGKMTTFYGRDRDETGVDYKTYNSFKELVIAASGRGAEYIYIMKDGQWYYSPVPSFYSDIEPKLTLITAELFETELFETAEDLL